jgi:hypothetical protein
MVPLTTMCAACTSPSMRASDDTTRVPADPAARDVAAHHAVHTQAAAEDHVAFDARRGADQAVDAVLRLARLLNIASPFPFNHLR